MVFEYDENKNSQNIKNHGISFRVAARVFFDYDRIELYDEKNSAEEHRFNTIGTILAGDDEVIFVVYTERSHINKGGREMEVIRLISARKATNFERGMYYGKF